MAKIYVQKTELLLNVPLLDASASTSGSKLSAGYAKAVGMYWGDVASETGSGVRIEQSVNGVDWVVAASGATSACGAISLTADITGWYVRAVVKNGSGAASKANGYFYLRPI